MPTSPDVFTGLNDTDLLAMQNDTQARMTNIFQNNPKSFSDPNDQITQPEAPKGLYGTVSPGQNINLDKTSPAYINASYNDLVRQTAQQYPDTYKALPDILVDQADTRKYINKPYGFDITRDNEDFYNKQQGELSQIGKSLFGRLPLLTISKLGTGIGYLLGLANPVNWFEKNTISAASDNWFAKKFEGMEDWIKQDFLPVYQSASARNMGFFDRAMGGDMTFWHGDVLDGAAFMSSAFVPGAIASKLSLGTKLLQGLGMTAERASMVSNEFLRAMSTGAVKNADLGFTTALNTASESMFEAKQVRDDVYNNLMKTGNYTDQEAKNIAGDKARNSFLSNLVALSASNLWEASIMFKALARGKDIPEKAFSDLAETELLDPYKAVQPETKFGKFLNTPLGFYAKKMGEGIAVEGFYEENIQQGIQQFNEQSADTKSGSNPNQGILGYAYGVLDRTVKQTIDAMQGKDKDTSMNIGVGALIGAVFGAAGSRIAGERRQEEIQTEHALANLNRARENWLKTGNIYTVNPETGKPEIDQAKVAAVYNIQAAHADKLNDILENIKDPSRRNIDLKTEFGALVSSHINNGTFDHLMTQLDGMRKWSANDLMKLGFDPEQDNVNEKVEDYKNYAAQIKDLKKVVDRVVPVKGEPLGQYPFRIAELMEKGSKRIAINDELRKVGSDIVSTESKIGAQDLSDDLVKSINGLKVRIASQQKAVENADEYNKPFAEKKLAQYQSTLDKVLKENEDSLKELKSSKDGYYDFKNKEKREHPLISELYDLQMKQATMQNAREDVGDEFNRLLIDTSHVAHRYGKQKETFEKVFNDIKQKQEEAKKETKTETPDTGSPTNKVEEAQVVPETKTDLPQETRKQRNARMFNDLKAKRDADLEKATSDSDIAAINEKFKKDVADVYRETIEEKPAEQQEENYKKLVSLIPDTKGIDVSEMNRITALIGEARSKGEISSDHESALLNRFIYKEVTGTGLDRPKPVTVETPKPVEGPGPTEADIDKSVDQVPTLVVDGEYDPSTADVPDVDPTSGLSSAIAWETSNKTVTQEELEASGQYTGHLDEDPYKAFKQGFLRNLLKEGIHPEEAFSGKIVKDNDSLPHSKESEDFIKKGNSYGSVLVITDSAGNDLYFDENYIAHNEPGEGRQKLVYSFNKTYWDDLAPLRAIIGENRTGISSNDLMEKYKDEAEQQELVRQLNDQGKEVNVSFAGISSGALRKLKDPVKSSTLITKDMNPLVIIPPAPIDQKFDPNNPTAHRYVLVDNRYLLNGAMYAQVKDPETNISNYVRLIPNLINEVPGMIEEVQSLLNHTYRDDNEAAIAANYLTQILFLGKKNRPDIVTVSRNPTEQVGPAGVSIRLNGKLLDVELAMAWVQLQRFNVVRENVNYPDEYPAYVIKNGQLDIEERNDYHQFLLDNSVTRDAPLMTPKGKKYVAINTYMGFTFDDSLESMKNNLAKGVVSEFNTPPGERPMIFNTSKEIPAFRHEDDVEGDTGKTSGQNNIPLNEKGRKGAAELGEVLKAHKITSIISSPIERAKETAKIAAKVAGITKVSTDPDFKTWDIGEWVGTQAVDFPEDWFVKNPTKKDNGSGKKVGETFNTYRKRMVRAYNKIANLDEGTAVIAHSRNVRYWTALSHNEGLDNDETLEKYLTIPSDYAFVKVPRFSEAKGDNSTLVRPGLKELKRKDTTKQEGEEGLAALRTDSNGHPIVQSEIDKVNQMFGYEVAKLVDAVANSNVVGLWTTSGITLYKDAQEGDGYHEAWHHFSQIYLNHSQKRALYDEARKRGIDFTNREGRKLNSRTASDFQLEEMVADDFRDYVLSDGKSRLVERPYRNNIFRKILDFLKGFFFGEINLSKLYEDLRTGNLNKYQDSVNNARWGKLNASALNQNKEEIFNSQKSAYFGNMISYFFGKQLLKEKKSIDYINKNPKKASRIYENVYNDVWDRYYKPFEKSGDLTDKQEDFFADIYQLLSNWEDMVQYHKEYSKLEINLPHYLQVNVPENPEDRSDEVSRPAEDEDVEEELSEAEPPTQFGSNSTLWVDKGNTVSSLESASPETRALVRMLPAMKYANGKFIEQLDENDVPKLNDYARTWTLISMALANKMDYDKMIAELNRPETQKKIPEVTELLKHLPDPNGDLDASAVKTLVGFERDFGKSYIGIYSGRLYYDGSHQFNEETRRNKDQVRKIWTANFVNKPSTDGNVLSHALLIDDDTGKYYINSDFQLGYDMTKAAGREGFLDLMGFKFSDEAKLHPWYSSSLPQRLKDLQNNINTRLNAGQRLYNPVFELTKPLVDEETGEVLASAMSGVIDGMLYFESDFTTEVPTMSYQTAEGTMIYGLSLNNTLSITTNLINNATHYDDIVNNPETQHLNVDNNPNVRGSLFLNEIFNLGSKITPRYGLRKNNSIVVGNYNGFKFEDIDGNWTGYSTTSLNTRQKFIYDINSLISKGATEMMRTEASKSAYFFKLAFYEPSNAWDKTRSYLPVGMGEFATSFASPKFRNIMINNYLYDELSRIKTAKDVDVFNSDPKLLQSAQNFAIFKDILTIVDKTEELKDSIKEEIKTKSVEDVIAKYRSRIEKNIEQFFTEELEDLKEELEKENIGNGELDKNFRDQPFDQKLRAFLANSFILNVEQTKLYDGDLAYQAHYKDFFKRAKGITSTGIIPSRSKAFAQNMRKGELYTFAGFVKSKINNDYRTYRTINIKDDERPSKYIDILKGNLKQNNPNLSDAQIDKMMGKYRNMNIGDGQGHITLDFYRQFLKSINNWSDSQELMYKMELAKFRLKNADSNEDYTEPNRAADREFLKKYKDLVTFFPPLKIQYNGPIKATGTGAMVMDKFSVAPLIPSVIQGTPLEDLHNEMIKHGISYSKFESGTKKYKHPPIQIYGEDGYTGLDLSNHEPATHFLLYLKEQINTNPDIKTESIFGSQVRKLIESNIFNSGKGREIDMQRHARYVDLVQKMMDIGKKDLFENLSIGLADKKSADEPDVMIIHNIKKFISTLRNQAEMRELNDNIMQYVQYDKDTDKMKYPLEASLNRKSIQDLIMGMIDSKLRLQNIAGDQLIQISSSGFQSKDFKYTGATDDEIKKYGTNGLRFYHSGTDGKTVSMQVKVGLNGGFEKLKDKLHPDGQKIGDLERLNVLLKDESWVNENRDHITMIGYRIPTQGFNSMEFMEVAEFLPPHVGSSIIVPAEIVAKSGSDFDIDKLSVFRPSFNDDGSIVKGDSKEAYSNSIIDLFKEVLSDPTNFEQLVTPNDTDLVKPEINELAVSLGKRRSYEVYNNKTKTYTETGPPKIGTQVLRYITNMKKFESLLSASKLLGIFAVNNSFITLLQQAGVTSALRYKTKGATRNVKFFLLSPQERAKLIVNGRVDVGNKYNAEGNLKQAILSQLINATVDAPSDDFFGYANVSYENAGVLAYLISNHGVPFDRAMWFINQPILTKYYSELRGKKVGESKAFIQAKLLGQVLDKDFFLVDEEDPDIVKLNWSMFHQEINNILESSVKPEFYLDKAALKKRVRRMGNEVNNFVEDESNRRLNALTLSYFISLQEQQQLFRDFQGNLLVDTKKIPSPVSAWQAFKAVKKIDAAGLFNEKEYNKVLNSSIIGPFDNRKLIASIGLKLMPIAFDPAFMIKAAEKIAAETEFKPKPFVKKFTANYENQFIEYIVKSLGKINGNDLPVEQKRLLEGADNLARRFNNLITQYPQLKEEYPIVSKIRPNFSNRAGIIKSNLEIYRLFENNQDDQNRYIHEFRSLIDFDDDRYDDDAKATISKFFKDMALLGFLQSGFSRSNISFQELVPYEELSDMIKTALTDFVRLIRNDRPLLADFIAAYAGQFNSNNKISSAQSWRGKDYNLTESLSKIIRAKKSMENFKSLQTNADTISEIQFEEDPSSGYAPRTKRNAASDATIAIAVDFNSAGERLTESSVRSQKKTYIAVDANNLVVTKPLIDKIVGQLNAANAKTLNIAGNGIYTMKGRYTQQQIDQFTYLLLKNVLNSPNLKTKIESINTGGQTGFDEAGAKAAQLLGLKVKILAPKGWIYRDIDGKDISSEKAFKDRFLKPTKSSPGGETDINGDDIKPNTPAKYRADILTDEEYTDLLRKCKG